MFTLKKSLFALGIGSALLVAGCSTSGDSETPAGTSSVAPSEAAPSAAPSENEAPAQTPDPDVPGMPVDALGAVEAALSYTPGAVVEVDFDDDENVWEVEVLLEDGRGLDVYVDVATGEVLRERDTPLSSWQREAPQVTASEAISIALTEKPGAVRDLDLDREGGRVAWEVEVFAEDGTEWDFYIDPTSGEVLSQEQDD